MSFHVFFSFSTGLSKPLKVPKGTRQRILDRIARTEKALCLKRERYKDNPWHWRGPDWRIIDDKIACETATEHNAFVRHLYDDLGKWSKEVPAGPHDLLRPKESAEFFPGLRMFDVPAEKWTKDYYRDEMETLYEVMRGRETHGINLGAKPLTPEQAGEVINLFGFLDSHDIRLAVPVGHDHLKSSYDGGYRWCEKCGAIDENDLDERCGNCPKKGCPIKAEFGRD